MQSWSLKCVREAPPPRRSLRWKKRSCGGKVYRGGSREVIKSMLEEKIMKAYRIVGHVVFGGELDPDPVAAEIDLRSAGYTVARMPDRLRPFLYHPQDDFLKAYIDVTVDVDDRMQTASRVDAEIQKIVNQYGGDCMECGAEPADYRPESEFDIMFKEERRR
jgi:FAD/FMN-containing dehydrogenase